MSRFAALQFGSAIRGEDFDLPHVEQLPAGSRVVTEGKKYDHLYSIRAGMIRIHRTDGRGRSRTVGYLFSGDFIGVNCAPTNTCRYSAETVIPTTVCRWPRHCVEALVCEVPAARKLFLSELSHEMNLVQQRMELLDHDSARSRVAAFIKIMASRMDRDRDKGQAAGRYPFSHADVADYLNLSPESLSLAIRSFEESRIFRLHGADEIEMLNVQALFTDA